MYRLRSLLSLVACLCLWSGSGLQAPAGLPSGATVLPSGGGGPPSGAPPGGVLTAFERDGGVAYVTDFFSEADFALVRSESESMRTALTPEKRSFAQQRLCATSPNGSPLAQLFATDRVVRRLSELTGLELAPELRRVPLELRAYGTGSQMPWHVDDPLPGVAKLAEATGQEIEVTSVEVVLTVDNDSDSETQWLGVDGEVVSARTQPNSAVLIRAEGPQHRVTPLGSGTRRILKAGYSDRPDNAAPRKGRR
ncbi:hypothetical protein M885DRAFT_495525 [Pelagophyceae sp. CCMP2097]|nr:hypothetical protein M885DRAFT_495525 [Pelagophyceae sp. CCMP2097]